MMISPGSDDGIPGETRELYPAFLQAARKEKKSEAGKIFSYAALVEEVHAEVFARALEAARAGHDLAAAVEVPGLLGVREKNISGSCRKKEISRPLSEPDRACRSRLRLDHHRGAVGKHFGHGAPRF
jgi:rubrerythrin